MLKFTRSIYRVISNPYMLIAPVTIIFAVFLLYPVLFVLYVSLHRWRGVGPVEGFVGLQHYIYLFSQDTVFPISLFNTLKLATGATILQVGGALFLAILLDALPKGRLIYRTVFFIPCIMSLIAVGLLWNWVYNPSFGLLNTVLKAVSLDNLCKVWLGDRATALPAVLVAYSWQWMGIYVVIFLAGLQNIRPSYYEIAQLEGARWYHRLIDIILPCMRNQLFICLMLVLVFTFRLLPLVYVMTMGGPAYATEVFGLTIYRYGFRFYSMDRAAAMSFILVIIVILVSIFYTRFIKRGVTEI